MAAVTKIQNDTKSLFERCAEIDVSDITHSNYQGIKYISWADAWARLKKFFPDTTYRVECFGEGKVPYLKTEFGVFVQVTVTIQNESVSEMLPVMNNKMEAMATPDARDINDTIKRCLVKAMALHGFGISLYQKDDLYAKEDRPAPRQDLGKTAHSSEFKFTFGKFKGHSFSEIPQEDLGGYIEWLTKSDPIKNKSITDAYYAWKKAHKITESTFDMNETPPTPSDFDNIPF